MNRIKEFYRLYYENMQEFFLKFEAEDYGLTEENYWGKVLKPTSFTPENFQLIEKKLELKIPLEFKEFFCSRYSLETVFDLSAIHIVGNQETKPFASLNDYLFEDTCAEEINSLGLIPFGMYNDEWYICFDTTQDEANPPIVLYEMSQYGLGREAVSHKNWFSNFAKFLECMNDYQMNGNSTNFNSIDPENNFDTAYSYWKV
jgi:hypothetical protein